jgi:hypothetical protein
MCAGRRESAGVVKCEKRDNGAVLTRFEKCSEMGW